MNDIEFEVKKCPTTEYPNAYTFEVSGRNQEINFIELINQVADEINWNVE